MNIKDLLDYSKPGIWGFINEKDKRVFISYSNNILASVSRNISQIQDKSHSCRKLIRDLPNLTFVMLVCNDSTKTRKIRAVELMDSFVSRGYVPYTNKLIVSYKIRIVVTTDFKIHVLLVNRRNDKTVIGVFDKMDEASSFIQHNYPNNKIHNVIYSDNSLTKEFIRSKGIRV